MDDLIEALLLMRKYHVDSYAPVHCEHDIMRVFPGPLRDPYEPVSAEDDARLEELGFIPDAEYGGYYSFRFGSA